MRSKHLTPLKIAPRKASSDLRQALDMFLVDCAARRLSPRTVEFYRWELDRALSYLEARGIADLAGIAPTHLRAYLITFQERELSDSSEHAAARSLRAWLNWCVREDLIPDSPMRKVKMPKRSNQILPAFAPDDVKRLLAACKTARDTAIVLCLLDTGCRAAEFVALDVGDVDLKTGTVMVRQGKGKRDRVTFLGSRAHKALWRYVRERPATSGNALWLSESSDERLTISGLQQLLQRLGQRANVPHSNPHTFRRSFALWSLRAGMDIFSLQKLMGHADLSVLRKYLDQVKEDLQEAHKRHGAVDSML